MSPLAQLRADARDIFHSALRACDIAAAFDRHLRFNGATLSRPSSAKSIQLDRYREILIVAFGKAATPMTDALLKRLPAGVPFRGICSAASLPAQPDPRIRYFAGGHPLPTAESFEAARETLRLLHRAGPESFVFFLISGGGSAMLELPRDPAISLEDTIAFHQALIASGADITGINTIRKQFSAVKGGRLAQAAPEAAQLSLLIADVPLKDVASVASSPTLPDHATLDESMEILDRYRLLESFPKAIREFFLRRDLEGCKSKEAVPPPEPAQYEVLLSDEDLTDAARDRARSLGYEAVIDNTCDDWDYQAASDYLLRRFGDSRRLYPRPCLISTGEITVKLEGETGLGGRNQQFALAAALELGKNPEDRVAVLSAGSDGIDGNSTAAGAIADPATTARARAVGMDPEAALARFDSFPLFAALGDALLTGPTGNNLRDLRILLAH